MSIKLGEITSSKWKRNHCQVESPDLEGRTIKGSDINNGLECILKDLTFPPSIVDAYKTLPREVFPSKCNNGSGKRGCGLRHPSFFTALAAAAYPYTPEKGDIWISAYKRPGDCDSITIAAIQTCKSLCRDWIGGLCQGHAYLEGKHGRKLTPHAYPIYISKKDNELVIFIDEPTYPKAFNDHGPGTGHIKSCQWITFPGGSLRVGAEYDEWDADEYPDQDEVERLKNKHGKDWRSSKYAPFNARNTKLEKHVYRIINAAWDDIERNKTTPCRLPPRVIDFQDTDDAQRTGEEIISLEEPPRLYEVDKERISTQRNERSVGKPGQYVSSISQGVFH